MSTETERIAAIHFDTRSVEKRNSGIEHERAVAVYDLLEENTFAPVGGEFGPYDLHLGVIDNRLMLDIRKKDGDRLIVLGLSLTPFRRLMRDYSMVCESYYAAIGSQSLTQVEAIDMGRRSIHNECAELLIQRLEGKVTIDQPTARRLFTLIYVLQTVGTSAMPTAQATRVLFVCTRNSIRSPMAERLLGRLRGSTGSVGSAGLMADPVDQLAAAAMAELDVDLSQHRSRRVEDLSLTDFDLLICLSPEASAQLNPPPPGIIVEHWNVEDPTLCDGNRDTRLEAYRRVRNALDSRITARFSAELGKTP